MAVVEVRDLAIRVAGRDLLRDAELTLQLGECVAVVGPSGVGKTSLLNVVAGISLPDSGTVRIAGQDMSGGRPAQRSDFRLRHIGIVFQFGELLPELTARENVALPSRLAGMQRGEAMNRADKWLRHLDVAEHGDSHPPALSGGEVQRVGIARALAHQPAVVLADEPTGMLDEDNTDLVARLLFDSARNLGAAVLLVTHDSRVAAGSDRVLVLRAGRLTPA